MGKDDNRMMIVDAGSGRHEILTNCMNCGKIIAKEEGWGPCLCCGNPLEISGRHGVTQGDDRGYMDPVGKDTNEEEARFNKSFRYAKENKDRLLDFDRNAKDR